jgi:2-iminoacetate synthase ThiH
MIFRLYLKCNHSQEEYERLHEAGVHSVLVYQETYHQEVYKNTIPKERNLILIID